MPFMHKTQKWHVFLFQAIFTCAKYFYYFETFVVVRQVVTSFSHFYEFDSFLFSILSHLYECDAFLHFENFFEYECDEFLPF